MTVKTLWENQELILLTPSNPHLPLEEGFHLIVAPKKPVESAWSDPNLTGRAFNKTAEICKKLEEVGIAPWFNLQANGNWGLLPGGKTSFHIHIYTRNREGKTWGKPVDLPQLPDTFEHQSMPEDLRDQIAQALSGLM